jgi:predicted transcriptional regulator
MWVIVWQMNGKGYVTIRLLDSERERLETLAVEGERSLSAEIRLAIRNHLQGNGPAASEQGQSSEAATTKETTA